MISKEFYTDELGAAKLEAREWKEAHDKKAQELINLEGKFREYKLIILAAMKTLNNIK